MILAFSLLTLLVVTNPAFAAVKGGRRIIQGAGGPQFLVGYGGGIKSTGLGAGSGQYAISDGGFGQRLLYRTGQSQYPYGLLGNDYYSYPSSLLTAPRRVLRRKTVSAPNVSGLQPIGFSGARNGAVLVDPSTGQFSIGDAQVKTGGYGLRRNLYRTGLSPVPYGLMGMDYYSYPKTLLTTQRRLSDDFGLGQTRILGGGSAFTAGDSQIRGAIASPQVAILGDGLGDGYGQRKITTTTVQAADPLSAALGQGPVTQTTVTKSVGGAGLRGGNIILNGGPAIRRVKSLGGFGQRQVLSAGPISQAPSVQVVQAAPVIQTVSAGGPVRGVITRRPGDVFLQTVSRPRVAAFSRPVVQQRVSVVPHTGQVISSPVVVAPSQPQVISQVKTSPSLFGQRVFGGNPRMYYVDGGNRFMGIDIIGGSRIGDPRFGYGRLAYNNAGRFANIGLNQVRVPVGTFSSLDGQGSIDAGQTFLSSAPVSKTITQEETVGPLGDRQVVTTVTNSGSGLVGGKIGGLAAGGLSGIGQAPTQVVTQEQVVGPAGNPQILTTVTNTGSGLGGGKIGGLAAGSPLGFAGLSGNAPSKTITQEETVGPLGDRQVVTTVTNSGSGLGGGKIGGLATGGLAGTGQAPTQVITQEQVVGPAGDPQILTTVTNTGGSGLGSALAQEAIAQDPIESTLVQEAIGGNYLSSIPSVSLASPLSQTVQSVVDPLSSGQVSVDNIFSQNALSGSGLAQVRESSIADPFTGSVTKVTEVSQAPVGLSSGGFGGRLAQQNIADSLTQESINPSIGGSLFGYEPRVSFLSQYPYDVPDSGLLRSVLASRPIIQQQQDEQILVK